MAASGTQRSKRLVPSVEVLDAQKKQRGKAGRSGPWMEVDGTCAVEQRCGRGMPYAKDKRSCLRPRSRNLSHEKMVFH